MPRPGGRTPRGFARLLAVREKCSEEREPASGRWRVRVLPLPPQLLLPAAVGAASMYAKITVSVSRARAAQATGTGWYLSEAQRTG